MKKKKKEKQNRCQWLTRDQGIGGYRIHLCSLIPHKDKYGEYETKGSDHIYINSEIFHGISKIRLRKGQHKKIKDFLFEIDLE